MEKKKLGIILVILSFVFLGFIFYFNISLAGQSAALGCNEGIGCKSVGSLLSLTNIGFGFFGFMFALGFYTLFFNKTEEAIMKKLEDSKNEKVEDEKFGWVLKALDDFEKKVLKAVKEQDGITQSTLRLRVDMSKAKLSYVLQELEKRNLVKRVPKGKTMQVFLKV